MPTCIGRGIPGWAALLLAAFQILEPRDCFAGEGCAPFRVERRDNPGAEQRGGADRPLAFADEKLKAGAAILGGRDRHGAGREHSDIAAVILVEDAETPALESAEVEGMLDNCAEPGGFDRKGIVPLIALRGAAARLGMIVLVIGQPLAREQV